MKSYKSRSHSAPPFCPYCIFILFSTDSSPHVCRKQNQSSSCPCHMHKKITYLPPPSHKQIYQIIYSHYRSRLLSHLNTQELVPRNPALVNRLEIVCDVSQRTSSPVPLKMPSSFNLEHWPNWPTPFLGSPCLLQH